MNPKIIREDLLSTATEDCYGFNEIWKSYAEPGDDPEEVRQAIIIEARILVGEGLIRLCRDYYESQRLEPIAAQDVEAALNDPQLFNPDPSVPGCRTGFLATEAGIAAYWGNPQ